MRKTKSNTVCIGLCIILLLIYVRILLFPTELSQLKRTNPQNIEQKITQPIVLLCCLKLKYIPMLICENYCNASVYSTLNLLKPNPFPNQFNRFLSTTGVILPFAIHQNISMEIGYMHRYFV